MNRFLILLLVLLVSLAYSWGWNCYRKPYCFSGAAVSLDTPHLVDSTVSAPPADTIQRTVEEQILFKPLDIYFVSGQSGILHSPEVDTFLVTAKKYLAKNPDKHLLITGHTDSDGTEELNQKLSIIRADKVKALLAADGIRATQVTTNGKGEKEPLASNETNEGKAKNRRATIRLAE